MQELKILSRLLDYPDQQLWQHQADLCTAIHQSARFSPAQRQQLHRFTTQLLSQPLLDAQAAYGELFDRGRSTSLLLFEHVYGESRDRGQAMVDLLAQYQRHGLTLISNELPDHLPLYLEYLAQCPPQEARDGLQEVASILALLNARLSQRGSDYALLFSLLLALAGIQPDMAKVTEKIAGEARDDTPQVLDAVWQEEQVKFMADQGCLSSAVTAHQRRFVGSVAAQYLNIDDGLSHRAKPSSLP